MQIVGIVVLLVVILAAIVGFTVFLVKQSEKEKYVLPENTYEEIPVKRRVDTAEMPAISVAGVKPVSAPGAPVASSIPVAMPAPGAVPVSIPISSAPAVSVGGPTAGAVPMPGVAAGRPAPVPVPAPGRAPAAPAPVRAPAAPVPGRAPGSVPGRAVAPTRAGAASAGYVSLYSHNEILKRRCPYCTAENETSARICIVCSEKLN